MIANGADSATVYGPLFLAMLQPALIVNGQARVIDANVQAAKVLQQDRLAIINLELLDLAPTFQMSGWPGRWDSANPEDLFFTTQQTRLSLSGANSLAWAVLPFQVQGCPHYLLTLMPIASEPLLRQLQAELAQSQARLKQTLHAAPVLLFEQDVALRYTRVFNRQPGLFGVIEVGQSDADFLAPDCVQALALLKASVLEARTALRKTVLWRRIDGVNNTLELSMAPLMNSEGAVTGLIGTGFSGDMNMAVRRQLEECQVALAERTQETNFANESRTRFLATVSHELRTPLHTLLGYLRLALAASEGDLHNLLEIAERSGRQLATQIGDLLRFNRAQPTPQYLQIEVVEVRSFARQLGQTGQLLAMAGGNRMEVDIAPGVPDQIMLDEHRLHQVLENLIGNACKYTVAGEVRLGIALENEWAPVGRNATCLLRFSVEDSGIGIAEKDLPHIFDPFVRTSQAQFFQGVGLGLSIARQWIRAMGSDISVTTELGKGCRFEFVLDVPVVRAAPPQSVWTNTPVEAPSVDVRTLLLVDDVFENRVLLRRICEAWGYRVVDAATAQQALDWCSVGSAHVDAFLIDQLMPDIDGWGLLQRLRALPGRLQTPVAMISASPPRRPENYPVEIDFDIFLEKPLNVSKLRRFLAARFDPARFSDRHLVRTADAPQGPVVLPSAEDLAQLRQHLHLGRVMRMADWAQQRRAQGGADSAFCDQILRLTTAADLVGLGQLLNPELDNSQSPLL